MKRIRSGYGLGDNLYLQSIVRHLLGNGEKLQVCTDYPEVFLPVKDRVSFDSFSRHNINILAHYTQGKKVQGTTQFQDMCISAKLTGKVELKLDWKIQNQALINSIPNDKPIVCILIPRSPMDRKDNFGKEIMPDCAVLDHITSMLDATIIQLGSGKPLYELANIDIDLSNKTTITDMIDVASIADYFLGYCSFFIPLSESFNKPALFVWSSTIPMAESWFIRAITPEKVLHKPTSYYVMDDWSEERINNVVETVFDLRRNCRKVS